MSRFGAKDEFDCHFEKNHVTELIIGIAKVVFLFETWGDFPRTKKNSWGNLPVCSFS